LLIDDFLVFLVFFLSLASISLAASSISYFFFSKIPPPQRSTLFPYTTLFRSRGNPRRPRPTSTPWPPTSRPRPSPRTRSTTTPRSEEHTSELQSRFDLVCRLLLEKKNSWEVATAWFLVSCSIL